MHYSYNLLRNCWRHFGGRMAVSLGAYVILFLLWQFFQWGGEARRVLISDLAFLPMSLCAAGLTLWAARRPGLSATARRGWRLIGYSFFMYWLGDLCWFYLEVIRHAVPFPSVADLFYLAQYPLLLWGILTLAAAEPGGWRDWTKFWLDAVTVLISGWAATWYLVLGPTADAAGSGWLETLLSIGYPVGDLLVFSGLVVTIFRRRDDSSVAARGFLAAALILIFLGDLAYGRMALYDLYSGGDWPDSLWMLGQYCMVLAGYARLAQRPVPVPLPDRPPNALLARVMLLLPYGAVAVTYGLLIFAVRLERTAEGLLLGAVAVTIAVLARQVIVLAENIRLLRNRAELLDEIRRSEVRFRSLVQNSSDVIAVVEAGATIRYMSPSLHSVLGYIPDQVVGLPLAGLVHPADAPETLAALSGSGSGSRVIQCRLRHRDGAWIHAEATVNNMLHNPDVGGIVLNLRDVSERKTLEDQLTHQAFHDSLTDLANRALLRNRVQHALLELPRRGEPIALLFVDLDGFKMVNDSLGHAAGDELLRHFSQRLASCVRAADTVARLGGDEFAILMEGADEAAAARVARRVTEVLSAPCKVGGKEVYIFASTGIAISRTGAESADDLLRNADVAMYTAKGLGKGQHAFFDPSMHAAAMERIELESDLRWALERDEFYLEYQPYVQMESGRIAGVEALVRWQHPRRGTVSPGEFIPMAEETDLIIPLGRRVLVEACRQVAAWQRELAAEAPLLLNVNLSARQLLLGPDLVADVAAVLQETGLAPESLTLEITESVAVQGRGPTLETLGGLKRLGIRLAIDDFGTGYSSLSYLRGFPVDIVKIDRSFVEVVGRGFKETALVRGIIDLSAALGLATVAEGIERPDQVVELQALGCPLGQGYYFSRPARADQVRRWLAAPALPATTGFVKRDADQPPL